MSKYFKKIGNFFSRKGKSLSDRPVLGYYGVGGWAGATILLTLIIFIPWAVNWFISYTWSFAWLFVAALAFLAVAGILGKKNPIAIAGWIVAAVFLGIAFYQPSITNSLFWGIRWAFGST